MKTTTNNIKLGIKVKANVKAGGFYVGNHSASGLRVKSGVKAAGSIYHLNHSRRALA